MRRLSGLLKRILALFESGGAIRGSGLDYWEERVRKYGRRSVLNISHPEGEYEQVTLMQKKEIFPHFKAALNGAEKVVLDLGCGPGRFTVDLAAMIGGRAVGIDPIWALLDAAPKAKDVEYRLFDGKRIPLEDASVDVVWVCLVLINIKDQDVSGLVQEIKRVLKEGGLVFIVENTAVKANTDLCTFRTVETYRGIFDFSDLSHVHDYYDVRERISVMVGRRRS